MRAVTKKAYLEALAVHVPEVLEAGEGETSWRTFQDAIHARGVFSPEYAEQQAATWRKEAAARPAEPVDELDEYGLDLPHAETAEERAARAQRESHAEQERQRLLAAALKAGPRLFVP
jgi:hypothetical protein